MLMSRGGHCQGDEQRVQLGHNPDHQRAAEQYEDENHWKHGMQEDNLLALLLDDCLSSVPLRGLLLGHYALV